MVNPDCGQSMSSESEQPPDHDSGASSGNLFHGFTNSGQFLYSAAGARACDGPDTRSRRRKKTSRKHTRVQERLVYLERQGILRRTEHRGRAGASSHQAGVSQTDSMEQPGKAGSSDENGTGSTDTVSFRLPVCPSPVVTVPKEPATTKLLTRAPSSLSGRPEPHKLVAIDCEMVGTGPGGRLGELARCSVVNYSGDVIYDKYVKPQLPIVDYRTRWSGIRKEHMENAIPFSLAHREVLKILKGKVVVGHALHNDFKALRYFHPRALTRDTSKITNFKSITGITGHVTASLRTLTKLLLHRDIQVGRKGHSSVEDAGASMELYRLVEVEWEGNVCGQQALPPETSPGIDRYMDDCYWPKDLREDSK
ncbi:apoptosis-enhancing nuclease [Callorhinchus milii]|uniref:Exonuclease domain-containing protein n=1 Tax=Callorhinchus milii TaxID=7868 RepID=A0A4W3ILG4_CALMI|nr:apoptosis-enhancing nuclease [Callorhinchus milii]|eukprot:gi/632979541/ref/XP_007906528.1/ PREDICTED: apoptosis-enhancing nuclease [Callorhinchus milii]